MMSLVPNVTRKPVGLIVALPKEEFLMSSTSAVSRVCVHTYLYTPHFLDQNRLQDFPSLVYAQREKNIVPKIQQGHIEVIVVSSYTQPSGLILNHIKVFFFYQI